MNGSVGRIDLSNKDLRENFKVAAIMLSKANNVPLTSINLNDLTQGFLRSPILLTQSTALLQFPMSTLDQASITGAPNTPITNLVASVDAFVAGQMGYYLLNYQYSNGNGNLQNIDFTTRNSWHPVTYPSPWLNNSSSFALDPGVIIFWMGYIKIEVNSKILYKQWDLMRHLRIPRTQESPAVGVTPSQQNSQHNSFDGGNDTFYPMEPLPVFSGSKQNVVQMYLPANIPLTIAPFNLTGIGYNSSTGAGFVLMAVTHWRGVTCQNASGLK